MKKMLFLAATAALALSSCSSDEIVEQAAQKPVVEGAVSFSVYHARDTRAAGDPITDAVTLAENGGFGVFAYAQEAQGFDAFMANNVTPNFMYNQNVTSADGDDWTYTPVKYWSNNPGAKHSFFAYAPFTATANFGTAGNPSLVFNTMYEGPALKYTVDLANPKDILCAPAFIDKEKPALANINTAVTYNAANSGKMQFDFKHALAKLSFNAQIWVDNATDKADCDDDGANDPADPALDSNTKITIKSIKLIGNFAKTGILRLRDGKWDNSAAATETIELVSSSIVLANNKTEQDLTGLQDLLLIPQDGDEVFQIQIVYDVTTTDSSDGKNSSTITNTITSTESYPLAQNTAYQYHLNLGMETVKFAATVTDWAPTTPAGTEVDLPANN